MTKQLVNLAPLVSTNGTVIVELRKYMTELRKEDLETFNKELKEIARESKLQAISDFNSIEHTLARFRKI